MSNTLETALYSTAARTFEELAFMFPEPDDGPVDDLILDAGVSVVFHGPLSGRLEVRVCAGVLQAVAMNMLGEEDTPPRTQQLDALGEIANVVCGNVLPVITDAQKVFHLDAPCVLSDAELRSVNLDSAAAFIPLQMDEGCAGIHLFLDTTAN